MKYMMFMVMLTVILGANFYVFFRLWHMIPGGNFLRWVLAAFAVVAVSSMFVSMLAGNYIPLGVTSFLYRLGTSWFFIMLYFVMLFLLADLVRLTHLVPALNKYMHGSWVGLGVSAALVAGVMIAGYIRYNNKDRVELAVKTDKEMRGGSLKIVAVSDFHLGYGIGEKELAKWVRLINAEKPDLVLIAGDIIDNSMRPILAGTFADELRAIDSRRGVYAVPGNHEYISGIAECADFFEDAGITLLKDSAVLVDSMVWVVGRDDKTNTARKSVAQLTGGLDASKPIIILDHQPYNLEHAAENGVDLQLSGHTHRGQVWPISLITDGIYEKSHGYLKKGDTNYFVSSGLGIWGGKFRIGTRSEYIVITLSGK